MLFVEYPRCTTCKKAKKWLDEHNIDYEDRDIVKNNPQSNELKEWYEKSELPLKRFFNTSGKIYREKKLKDKLPDRRRTNKSTIHRWNVSKKTNNSNRFICTDRI